MIQRKITYGYLLDGFHEDWIESDHEHRVATMTNVPPGNYEFRVRARYERGDWQERRNPISITILPPPWKTWWAYLSYAAALLATITIIYRYRTAALRRRATELEKAVADRTLELRNNEKEIQSLAEGLEIQLERNEQLIANISHEFRTPLTLILGPANRLLRKVEKPENQALLQMIRRNSHRLLRLVDQLLGLSRLKAGDQLAREAQSVNAAVDGIAGSFGPAVVERELKLSTFAEPGLWVLCTPDTLDNIVLNLLSNAVKNTPEGGSITVHAEGNGEEWVRISVEDTGIGISEQDQKIVFDRFHRLGDQKEQQPGSGIGLALVKELVIEHGGRVELTSQLQKGTTVSVTLPRTSMPADTVEGGPAVRIAGRTELEVETARESESAPKPASNLADSDRPLVLVVEDNADMRHYLYELLVSQFDCIEAENGDDAVQLAVEYVPDLVLCDIVLPGMDGFHVAHVLKEDERTCHVPIILLTARHDRESRLEGWKEKVDGYLTKPFNDEELLLRISNLLEIREILKSRFTDHFFSENGKNGMQPKDRAFLNKLESEMEKHHADEHFGLEQMADVLYVSPRQLQRKLKAVTGQNPAGFLRAYPPEKSAQVVEDRHGGWTGGRCRGLFLSRLFQQLFQGAVHIHAQRVPGTGQGRPVLTEQAVANLIGTVVILISKYVSTRIKSFSNEDYDDETFLPGNWKQKVSSRQVGMQLESEYVFFQVFLGLYVHGTGSYRRVCLIIALSLPLSHNITIAQDSLPIVYADQLIKARILEQETTSPIT